jgi:RNA polymerase sigma factor (sigma-70 family)
MSHEEAPQAPRARGQREDRFEDLVKLHRGELTRYAVRQLGEQAGMAEDVVQEALLSAHRAMIAGTDPVHPRAWLFTIVRNAAINASRSARPTNAIEDGHGSADQTVAAAVEQSEWIDWLMGAVGQLPDRQRDALVGRAFEGRSYSDIAARQQTTIPAVKSLLVRARRALSADSSFSGVGAATPLAAAAGAVRALLVRGPLAGKAGGAKGLVGVLAQAVLAATVTTGVLMAVHGGGLGSVLASTGPARSPGVGEYHPVRATPSKDHSGKRVRQQRAHREGRRAVSECMHGAVRRHYGEAALQYAASHVPAVALEYTECEQQLRYAALGAASNRHAYPLSTYKIPHAGGLVSSPGRAS